MEFSIKKRKGTVKLFTRVSFTNYLITACEGFIVKVQTEGWDFCFMDRACGRGSINQKLQLEVWNFTVRPEDTRLLSCLLYGFRYRQIVRGLLHSLHFPSQFRHDNKFQKRNVLQNAELKKKYLFCSISCFFF